MTMTSTLITRWLGLISLATAFTLTTLTTITQAQPRPKLVIPSGHSGLVINMAYLSQPGMIASTDGSNIIAFWEEKTHQQLNHHYSVAVPNILKIKASPAGTALAVLGHKGQAEWLRIRHWDVSTQGIKGQGFLSAVFMDEQRLVLGHGSGSLHFLENGEEYNKAPVSDKPLVQLTHNGDMLYAVDQGGTLFRLSLDGQVLHSAHTQPDEASGLVCLDNFLVMSFDRGSLLYLDAHTLEVQGRDRPLDRIFDLAKIDRARALAVGRGGSAAVLCQADSLSCRPLTINPKASAQGFYTALALHGKDLLLPHQPGEIGHLSLNGTRLSTRFSSPARPLLALATDPTGRWLVVGGRGGLLGLLDTRSRQWLCASLRPEEAWPRSGAMPLAKTSKP